MINSFNINSRVTSLSCYTKSLLIALQLFTFVLFYEYPEKDGRYSPTVQKQMNARQVWGRLYTCYDYTLLVEGLCFLCFVFFFYGRDDASVIIGVAV